MRPPAPVAARDTTGLDELDAMLLADATQSGLPIPVPMAALNVPTQARHSERLAGRTTLERALEVVSPLVSATAEWHADDGYVERHTFAPSAGARHPLTALILTKADEGSSYARWAVSPSLAPQRFEVTEHDDQIRAVLNATAGALQKPKPPWTVIVLLARFRRTLSKYPDGDSLVWRDSGVFLGSAHLIAVSLGLRSCIAGIADTTRFTLRGTSDTLTDVGALVISERDSSSWH